MSVPNYFIMVVSEIVYSFTKPSMKIIILGLLSIIKRRTAPLLSQKAPCICSILHGIVNRKKSLNRLDRLKIAQKNMQKILRSAFYN